MVRFSLSLLRGVRGRLSRWTAEPPSHDPRTSMSSLPSGVTRCSKFILCAPCPRSGFSHFSKDPWGLETIVWVLELLIVHCFEVPSVDRVKRMPFFKHKIHPEILLIEPIQGCRGLTSSVSISVSPFNHTKNLSKPLPPRSCSFDLSPRTHNRITLLTQLSLQCNSWEKFDCLQFFLSSGQGTYNPSGMCSPITVF